MSDIEIDVEAFGRRASQLIKAIGVSAYKFSSVQFKKEQASTRIEGVVWGGRVKDPLKEEKRGKKRDLSHTLLPEQWNRTSWEMIDYVQRKKRGRQRIDALLWVVSPPHPHPPLSLSSNPLFLLLFFLPSCAQSDSSSSTLSSVDSVLVSLGARQQDDIFLSKGGALHVSSCTLSLFWLFHSLSLCW